MVTKSDMIEKYLFISCNPICKRIVNFHNNNNNNNNSLIHIILVVDGAPNYS